jgi:hypothetical protein
MYFKAEIFLYSQFSNAMSTLNVGLDALWLFRGVHFFSVSVFQEERLRVQQGYDSLLNK